MANEECRTQEKERKGCTEGPQLDPRSIEMEKRRGSPSGQVYLPPFLF